MTPAQLFFVEKNGKRLMKMENTRRTNQKKARMASGGTALVIFDNDLPTVLIGETGFAVIKRRSSQSLVARQMQA